MKIQTRFEMLVSAKRKKIDHYVPAIAYLEIENIP
jgi:hypothetical protein